MSRERCCICRVMTSIDQSRCSWTPLLVVSCTALPMAASGFLSSWASMARNSSLRSVVRPELLRWPAALPARDGAGVGTRRVSRIAIRLLIGGLGGVPERVELDEYPRRRRPGHISGGRPPSYTPTTTRRQAGSR